MNLDPINNPVHGGVATVALSGVSAYFLGLTSLVTLGVFGVGVLVVLRSLLSK
jgi:hypothetical protein